MPFAAAKPDAGGSLAVWALTPRAAEVARRIWRARPGVHLRLSQTASGGRLPDGARSFNRLADALAGEFSAHDGHVFVMASGIVVRLIAPLLDCKTRDPAVVVVDEDARHAISLVSGHIGGANALAVEMAHILGARPVITTATDVNALPAIDVMAVEQDLLIENPGAIRYVSMALLKGEKPALYDPHGLLAPKLPQATRVDGPSEADIIAELGGAAAAVFIDDRCVDLPPQTLILRPRSLVVGMGCNRGTPSCEMRALLGQVLAGRRLAAGSIFCLASIDIKRDEPGLLELADELNVDIRFFSRAQLNAVSSVPTPSEMVRKHTGASSVCEAAALRAAKTSVLVVPKQKTANVTVAIARIDCISSASDPAAPTN